MAAPLLEWFEANRRALPWRTEPRDPYRTWLSEVMAQQTRLDVVVPYFDRFVGRFPTLAALAAAPLEEVLSLWSGLGYYARARNLHRAAQAAVARGGALPATFAELSELPGFGPYTAAAVASLAFGEDVPLVDGNVARVLARVLRLPGDAAQVRPLALAVAANLLPAGKAGPFNEALMELGATVCTPRSPACPACPLETLCAARAEGDPEAFPAAKPKKARPELHWAGLALRRADGRILVARRPDGDLFAGLWELPSAPVALDAPAADAVAAIAACHALPSGCAADVRPAGEVAQTLTHRQVTLRLFSARLHGTGGPPSESLRWVEPTQAGLGALGISSLAAKALKAVGIAPPQRPRKETASAAGRLTGSAAARRPPSSKRRSARRELP